jgi:hypothetical protein
LAKEHLSSRASVSVFHSSRRVHGTPVTT